MNEINAGWELMMDLLFDEAKAVAGEWNGDEAGAEEERAMRALEVMEKTRDLIVALHEFSEGDK